MAHVSVADWNKIVKIKSSKIYLLGVIKEYGNIGISGGEQRRWKAIHVNWQVSFTVLIQIVNWQIWGLHYLDTLPDVLNDDTATMCSLIRDFPKKKT